MNNENIEGGLNVRQDVTAGGKIIGRQGAQVNGDLQVSGAIRSQYVSSANMGLFKSLSELKTAYPKPKSGWYAMVGSGFPAELYLCVTAGTWEDTYTTVAADAPTSQVAAMMQDAASALVSEEELRAEYAEQVLGAKITKETKDREWGESHLKDMCRRLAVLLMGKQSCRHRGSKDCHDDCLHCCCCDTDPDWLWKELLLGIRMDTETDVLTIAGVEYKLKRLNPDTLTIPTITIEDVTTDESKGGYSPTKYPAIKDVTGAVYRITLAQSEGYSIKYKIIQDGTEPSSWTEYTGAKVINVAGTYSIKAIAYDDTLESDIATSDEFTVTEYQLSDKYTKVAFALAYTANISAAANELSPSLTTNFLHITTCTNPFKDSSVASTPSIAYSLVSAVSGVTIVEDGTLTFNANTSTTSTRVASVKAIATLDDGSTYEAVSNTITQAKAAAPTIYAYYGASADEPTEVSTSNSKAIPATISITSESTEQIKYHWVAVLTSSGYTCTKLTDKDGDDITTSLASKVIGDYTIYYYTPAKGYIANTSNFVIK